MHEPRLNDGKGSFNVIASVEKHIQDLIPLRPKQAIIGIGEYPIKTLLKSPRIHQECTLPIFIERSTDDIYKWIPKGYDTHIVLGFEDSNRDTHFWYEVLPVITKNTSLMASLKKRTTDKLQGAIIFSSIWDGIGSASLPTLISKLKVQTIDSMSIAILPSKVQPADAHFNAYAALQMCGTIDGATVVLLGRDQLEKYEGVDRKGAQIKGNSVVNYLLDMFLSKSSLVQEIAELSRTFNTKMFSVIAATAASYQVYGSIENMLNTALLKPLLSFNLSSASLLYVLLRMPANLKEKVTRTEIELSITNWFKEKTSLQSIHISEPVYTDDMNDRIDAVLFVGGFDMSEIFAGLEKKSKALEIRAIAEGYMTKEGYIRFNVEQEVEKAGILSSFETTPQIENGSTRAESPNVETATVLSSIENIEQTTVEKAAKNAKPKRKARRTKKINK
jgi:hypothetical protein